MMVKRFLGRRSDAAPPFPERIEMESLLKSVGGDEMSAEFSSRCLTCANLRTRYKCDVDVCYGIIAIPGGWAPLEAVHPAEEAQFRQLAANGWYFVAQTPAALASLQTLQAAASSRICVDEAWLLANPEEDPSPNAISSRRLTLARFGIALRPVGHNPRKASR